MLPVGSSQRDFCPSMCLPYTQFEHVHKPHNDRYILEHLICTIRRYTALLEDVGVA
jgi:hypothetical protein